MERALSRLPGFESVSLLGIRHLSPGGAFHAERVLHALQPDCVLLELPADARGLLDALLDAGTVPPVALLSWTESGAGGMSVLPLAEFSPEWRVLRHAADLGAEVRFIDLPASRCLPLDEEDAQAFPQTDFEEDWELGFEHGDTLAYLDAIRRLSEAAPEKPGRAGELDRLREGYMRREIETAASEGFSRILVVAGAYHTARLACCAPLTDDELRGLPAAPAEHALVPYAVRALRCEAPGYLSLLYDCLSRGDLALLPERYLSGLAERIRREGGDCPTGAVIDAARLAKTLAGLRGKPRPCLDELREAAECCLSGGERRAIARAAAAVEAGRTTGTVAVSSARLPVEADFERQLRALGFERCLREPGVLRLDLRPQGDNVSLDAKRSAFLHRLRVLGSPFAVRSTESLLAHAEKWTLQNDPDSGLCLARSAPFGRTVAACAARALAENLAQTDCPERAAGLVADAVLCGLPEIVRIGLGVLESCALRSAGFAPCARAAAKLAGLAVRAALRGGDTKPLERALETLRLHAALLLPEAARCDRAAAGVVSSALNVLFDAGAAADGRFVPTLRRIDADPRANPRLSGLALALLAELGEVPGPELDARLKKRLSPGEEAERAAEWIAGLLSRNPYALLYASGFLGMLDDHIASLPEDGFVRALPVLRRALSPLEAAQRADMVRELEKRWLNPIDSEKNSENFDYLHEYSLEELL